MPINWALPPALPLPLALPAKPWAAPSTVPARPTLPLADPLRVSTDRDEVALPVTDPVTLRVTLPLIEPSPFEAPPPSAPLIVPPSDPLPPIEPLVRPPTPSTAGAAEQLRLGGDGGGRGGERATVR